MKRIVIHIGTAKTGTTSVQTIFSSNREELRKKGVFYPPTYLLDGNNLNHNEFTHALKDDYSAKKIFELYLRDFTESGCNSMLLSSEKLFAPNITEKAIKVLGHYRNNYQISILCVLKRQDYFIESLYAQRVDGKSKLGANFNTFSIDKEPIRSNYLELLDLWNTFSPEIVVHNFHELIKKGDLSDSLLNSVNLPLLNKITEKKNVTPDSRLIQVMSLMNNYGLKYTKHPLICSHESVYSNEMKQKFFYTREKRKLLLDKCSEQNNLLYEKYKIRFDSNIPDVSYINKNEFLDIEYSSKLIDELSRWPNCNDLCNFNDSLNYPRHKHINLLITLANLSHNKLNPKYIDNVRFRNETNKRFYENLKIPNFNECKKYLDILVKYFPNCLASDRANANYFHSMQNWEKASEKWQLCINNYDHQDKNIWRHKLVQCHIKLEDYTNAILGIDILIRSNANNYQYQITKANIFINSNNFQDAENLLDNLIKSYPKMPGAYQTYLDLYKKLGGLAKLEQFANIFITKFPDNNSIRIHIFNFYFRVGEVHKAELELKRIIDKTPLFLPAYRWYLLLIQMNMDEKIGCSKLKTLHNKIIGLSLNEKNFNLIQYYTIRAKIAYSLSEMQNLKYCVNKIMSLDKNNEFAHGVLKILEKMKPDRKQRRFDEKVFVIGLSKTGTTSINFALEILGYHSSHFINKYTFKYLTIDDAFLFDALTDATVCCMFEKLYHRFPNAKFIYTVRDIEKWEKSIKNHFFREHMIDNIQSIKRFKRHKIWDQVHKKLFTRYGSWSEAYSAYDKYVTDFFSDKPDEKFLVLDISKTGQWEKICKFLNKDIPNVKFPFKNNSPQNSLLN